MKLVSVAAIADNLVIGHEGRIPWGSFPEDKKQYRALVAGAPVILGRKTFDSMRDDLPGRIQIVLSRTIQEFEGDSIKHAGGVADVIDLAESTGATSAYVLGGASIYALFQPHLDRMVLTRVPGDYEGDTYYPTWDETEWELETTTQFEGFRVEEWTRPG